MEIDASKDLLSQSVASSIEFSKTHHQLQEQIEMSSKRKKKDNPVLLSVEVTEIQQTDAWEDAMIKRAQLDQMESMRDSIKDIQPNTQAGQPEEPRTHFEETKNDSDSDEQPSKLMVLPKFDETMFPNDEMSCTDLRVFMEIREQAELSLEMHN